MKMNWKGRCKKAEVALIEAREQRDNRELALTGALHELHEARDKLSREREKRLALETEVTFLRAVVQNLATAVAARPSGTVHARIQDTPR